MARQLLAEAEASQRGAVYMTQLEAVEAGRPVWRRLVAVGVNQRHEAKAGQLTVSVGERTSAAAELRPLGAFNDPEQRRDHSRRGGSRRPRWCRDR